MDAIKLIEERRSVRRYKNRKVDHETMKEIVSLSRWAPSWANYQISRYTLVDDESIIKRISEGGVHSFSYNRNTLINAPGLAVLSFVKGKSGKLDPSKGHFPQLKASGWEMFDAGIACQTFCLAAHAKGIGTCIFGVIDGDFISQLIHLPQEETVAALIVYGYEEGEHAKATPRKTVEEILRFI